MTRPERAVVVLGGNAFASRDGALTMAGQFARAEQVLRQLVPLLESGVQLVIGHGNGPQVGHMLVRVERALGEAYALPLEVCVAESEGELGYVIDQTLVNVVRERGIQRAAVSVLTQVVVQRGDAAFGAPDKPVLETDLRIELAEPERVRGKRVLVVEDGPTLTHGGMAFGAGTLAARAAGAAEVIDARPHARGSIAGAFAEYAHIGPVLPALGYSEQQLTDLAETIRSAAPDVVVDASPARLDRLLSDVPPLVRVDYELEQVAVPDLFELVDTALG